MMRHQIGYATLGLTVLVNWAGLSATVSAIKSSASNVLSETPASLDANSDLKVWLDIWRTFIPRLDAGTFSVNSSESFPSESAHRFVIEEGRDLWDVPYWSAVVSSPDGFYAIGWSSEVGDPDSQAYLINLKTREAVRVLSCGTPCRYDLGAWLDSRRFLVAGTIDSSNSSLPPGHRLRLEIFSLDTSIVTDLEGPLVSYEQLNQFRKLWHGWLAERFPLSRSLKAERWEKP